MWRMSGRPRFWYRDPCSFTVKDRGLDERYLKIDCTIADSSNGIFFLQVGEEVLFRLSEGFGIDEELDVRPAVLFHNTVVLAGPDVLPLEVKNKNHFPAAGFDAKHCHCHPILNLAAARTWGI